MPSKQTFESLVEAYSREIFAYLWRLMGGESSAEDCLQETFLRAFRAYARFEPHGSARAWLYKIATNIARTQRRRESRLSDQEIAFDVARIKGDFSTLDEIEKRETLAAVAAAVNQLPHKQRTALILRKYQGLSYAEISVALGGTEDAARANVYQALKRLRAIFVPPQT
jgi:RNA polymerase sigma-70 factor (ECF subfamily)